MESLGNTGRFSFSGCVNCQALRCLSVPRAAAFWGAFSENPARPKHVACGLDAFSPASRILNPSHWAVRVLPLNHDPAGTSVSHDWPLPRAAHCFEIDRPLTAGLISPGCRVPIRKSSVMARYIGPKVKLSRRVGVPIADIPKHTGKELELPGMHGFRGRRSTEYGVRLTEKQKLRYHYGMLERQFRKFLAIAKKSKGNTGNTMMALLEKRLDNVARRLGVGRTIWATRQIVGHGHVVLNGQKTDISSVIVKPGDVITFKEGIHKVLRENMEQGAGHQVPGWLEWNPAQLTAKVLRDPVPEDVPFEVNMNLIIEFYR